MQWGSHRTEHSASSSQVHTQSPQLLSGQSFGSQHLHARCGRWDWAQVGTEHHLQLTACWCWLGVRYRGNELAATGRQQLYYFNSCRY